MTPRHASAGEKPYDDRYPGYDGERGDDHERPLLGEYGGPSRRESPASQASPHARETLGMADALGIVIVGVVIVAALVAVGTLVTSGRTYDQIGRGGLSLRHGSERPAGEPVRTGAAAARERDEEIRQLLEARNELRRRRGREPVDVEAELRALDRPAIDPSLEAEVRALVVARNERRVRQGREPLDVEAEVARELRELGGGQRPA
jgi:hypothetical protein